MRILYLDCFLGFDANMLLGALLDLGINPQRIENSLKESGVNVSVNIKNTTRSGIECKKAKILNLDANNYSIATKNEFVKNILDGVPESEYTNPLTVMAVLSAIEFAEAEYIICSDISIPPATDGNVISTLEQTGINLFPADTDAPCITMADAQLLKSITGESGPKPHMDIIAIGYGAGGENPENTHLLSAVLGEFDGEFHCIEDSEELMLML